MDGWSDEKKEGKKKKENKKKRTVTNCYYFGGLDDGYTRILYTMILSFSRIKF